VRREKTAPVISVLRRLGCYECARDKGILGSARVTRAGFGVAPKQHKGARSIRQTGEASVSLSLETLVTSRIHPSAIVDPGARIGAGVEIGPFSVVGSEVTIGDGTVLQSQVLIEGVVSIGTKNFIGHGAVIGTAPQDLSFSPERRARVEIGNENTVREYCTIHRGTAEDSATKIGDKNFLMAGAHVGHNCEIGNNVIIANNCLLGGYVRVDDGAFLGGGCVFHQFMHVGRLVIAQGGSAFSKDIPPFTLAAERNAVFGLNIIGLRRAGFSASERDEIKEAFKLVYQSGLNISQTLEKAASMNLGPLAREFFDFVAAAKKRGICPFKKAQEQTLNVQRPTSNAESESSASE
jgi:UDP-N-acetylglucosamine acyltransferase